MQIPFSALSNPCYSWGEVREKGSFWSISNFPFWPCMTDLSSELVQTNMNMQGKEQKKQTISTAEIYVVMLLIQNGGGDEWQKIFYANRVCMFFFCGEYLAMTTYQVHSGTAYLSRAIGIICCARDFSSGKRLWSKSIMSMPWSAVGMNRGSREPAGEPHCDHQIAVCATAKHPTPIWQHWHPRRPIQLPCLCTGPLDMADVVQKVSRRILVCIYGHNDTKHGTFFCHCRSQSQIQQNHYDIQPPCPWKEQLVPLCQRVSNICRLTLWIISDGYNNDRRNPHPGKSSTEFPILGLYLGCPQFYLGAFLFHHGGRKFGRRVHQSQSVVIKQLMVAEFKRLPLAVLDGAHSDCNL